MARRTSLPTDLAIFEAIYKRYKPDFERYNNGASVPRDWRIMVPVDLKAVASDLRCDPFELFGRLHHHLAGKHRMASNGSSSHFFWLDDQDPANRHKVNFPMLASLLADARSANSMSRASIWVSVLALGVALGSLVISALDLWLADSASAALRQPSSGEDR